MKLDTWASHSFEDLHHDELISRYDRIYFATLGLGHAHLHVMARHIYHTTSENV